MEERFSIVTEEGKTFYFELKDTPHGLKCFDDKISLNI